MKSLFIFLFTLLLAFFMVIPVFAGGLNPGIQKEQHTFENVFPQKEKKKPVFQQLEDKLAHSKVGKWVAKMGNRIFTGPRFNGIGYCMGFFLGFLGVLIVFLMDKNDTDKLISAFWGSFSIYLIALIAISLLGYYLIHNLHFPIFQFDLGNII